MCFPFLTRLGAGPKCFELCWRQVYLMQKFSISHPSFQFHLISPKQLNALSHIHTFNKLENKFSLKTQILENLQNARKCRNKNQQIQIAIQHMITQIFLVKVTLEKPPTNLGENQFESSFLFLKNTFYSERNIQKNQQVNFYNLSRFPCLTTTSENVQTVKMNQQ